ncbi:MAG: hypothetical protein KUG77_09735, partial [Nannocystaceae bacterium]|nr:hypothetical protein [Nannocystaceae bacterium]
SRRQRQMCIRDRSRAVPRYQPTRQRAFGILAWTMTARVFLALAFVSTLGCRPAPTKAPEPPQPAEQTRPSAPAPQPIAKAASEPAAPPEPDPTPPVAQAKEIWTADTVPPLSETERATFWSTAEDASPEVRGGIVKELEDVHYTIGNEWALWAFYDDIKNLGGGYVGVGPDQAYLFMGWQRPHLAWLIDYDSAVLRTHAMYKAVFAAAETPKEFVAMFEPANLERANAAIDAMYDGREARSLKGLLRRQRRYFRYRLRTLSKRLKGVDVPTYLTDQETYDYVKAMLRNDRVRPLLINLNAEEGIAGLNTAATKLQVPVRVLYVSNAEEYWDAYDPQFVRNVDTLHGDETSVLLRTRLTWKINRDYMYIVQSLDQYRSWLKADGVTRVRDILVGHPPTKADQVNHWRHDQAPPG